MAEDRGDRQTGLAGLALGLRARAIAVAPERVAGANLTEDEWEATERATKSYREFIHQAWHVIEPGTRFVPGYHIDAIAEHLEACRRREIRNLVITMPPRFMKSISVAVGFTPWVWIGQPFEKFLYSSYAMSLSVRDSVQARFLIQSDWYQRRWGHLFSLTSDQNVKSEFKNSATGYRIATSVDAGATGKGGGFIVCDDPINAREAESDAIRYTALEWWDKTMSTRLNDPKRDVKIVVMQRLHEKDVAGYVLEQGGYDHLNLPNEYEPTRHVTSIGWRDWRERPGELLWPERFGDAETRDAKLRLGTYGYSAQYQQRPSPAGGGKFQSRWFKVVSDEEIPWADFTTVCRFWDLAATEVTKKGQDPDFTAGALVAMTRDGRRYVLGMEHTRGNPGDIQKLVTETAAADGPTVPVRMEQEPGASGVLAIYTYRRLLAAYDFEGVRSTGQKEVRANPVSQQAQTGYDAHEGGYGDYVWHVREADWNKEFFHELEMFPFGSHDDQVDALSGAAAYLALSEERALARLWSPEHHVVAWSDFRRVTGSRSIPRSWRMGRAMTWDTSAARQPVMIGVAVPDEGDALAGSVFVHLLHSFRQEATPAEVAEEVRRVEGYDHLRVTRYSFINPEASSEVEAFVRHALFFQPWDLDDYRGIAQLRTHLALADGAHPFNTDSEGGPLGRRPQIYFLVDDSEVTSARGDTGMLALRQQIPAYYLSRHETGVPECGPALQALRALAASFFPTPEALSETERARRELERRFPHLAEDKLREQLATLPEEMQATLLQAREMYVDSAIRRARERERLGTGHIFAARFRRR